MGMFKSQVRFAGDPTRRYQLSRQQEPLTAAKLYVQRDPFFFAYEVLPGVPWGLLVPGESVVDRGAASARVDPQSSPPGSTFFMHFEVEGGERHEQSLLYIGTEPMLIFFLPQEWLIAAFGKRISVSYEVEWPDGTRVQAPGMSFGVPPPLEVPPILIEGVEYGAPLDPSQLPETTNVIVNRIPNLEAYHGARLRLTVEGWNEDGYFGPALDHHFPLNGAGEGPQIIRMQRSWLTYAYEMGFTDVQVAFLCRYTMLPPPNTAGTWGLHVTMGLNKVVPPSTR